jgi:putative ABC transport system permease protein
MSLWRHLTRGVRGLVYRDATDRDLADEVQHFFDEATRSLETDGLSPEQARRAVRRDLGTMAAAHEQVRSHGWEHFVETVIADLRYGARRLRGSPGFATVTILTLALGIGVSTAMFSAAKPTLIDRLPYPDAERIVTLWDHGLDDSPLEVTFGTYREVTTRSRSFVAVAVFASWSPSLTGHGDAERVDGQRVSAAYFDVVGVRPAIGRAFAAADDRPNGPKVVVVSDAFWRRRFGADPTLVGRQITLDDDLYTVLGVMPGRFENVVAESADVWRPLQYDDGLPSFQGREWGHHLRMVARLRADTALDQATLEVDRITNQVLPEFPRPPWAALAQSFIVRRLGDEVTQPVMPALIALIGAVGILLLIASVNVTNLLLGRGSQRRPELAMRVALGASRPQLIRQLLIETILLALPGSALGLAIAAAIIPAVIALAPPSLPRTSAIGLDGTVLGFAIGLSLAVALAAGILPAIHWSRGSALEGLRLVRFETGHHLTRRILVVAEVALAVVLLASAGLLLRSLQHLLAVSPGFDAANLVTMQVQTGPRLDSESRLRFFARALEEVNRVPGVVTAAFTSQLPLGSEISEFGVSLESNSDSRSQGVFPAFSYAVTPAYLETMRIPLHRGRFLDHRDRAKAPPVVAISESLAKQLPMADPIGQRIHIGPVDRPPYTIVGVVGDVKQVALSVDRSDAVYIATEQWSLTDNALTLVARTAGDPAPLTSAIRNTISSVDSNQPIARIATMDDLVLASTGHRRFAFALFQAFSIAALILAALGLYGILAGGVHERTREIGIRAVLGASPPAILALVLRQGLILTALGVAIGLAVAVAASQAVESLLFGISRLDVTTYVAVTILILGVSLFAAGIPARRAASVDAAVALRSE